ncbi:MAG: hypothetical protein ACREIQ_12975 [Nitrospiria bacterium]
MPKWIKILLFVAGIIGILWFLFSPRESPEQQRILEEYNRRKEELEEEAKKRREWVEKEREKREQAFQNAVKECTQVVRARSNFSDFDAYVTGTSVRYYFGDLEERFQFEKCMAGKGEALKFYRE